MHRSILIVLSISAVFLLTAAAPTSTAPGPWQAQIVDAETKQPLEGVVVVALWTKHVRGLGGASSQYYDSQEVLTDKDGRFTIAARSFFSLNPLVYFQGPEIICFKPGYGWPEWPGWSTEANQWSPEKRKKLGQPWEFYQLQGLVEEMPRLKMIEERKKHLRTVGIRFSAVVPHEKTPLLQQAILNERKTLGYRD